MNKKILMSLVVIGVVAAIVAGTTGAWWTDVATSSNTSFHSGNMDLQLANSSTGPWKNDVTQTWNYAGMVPGGTPEGDSLYLRNKGNTPADWLKIVASTTPTDATSNLDRHMRITELAYAGESLLTGGAGADLSNYQAPTNCTVTLSGSDRLQVAINAAASNDVICTTGTDYSTAWEGGPISVNKSVTIASMTGSVTSKISAGLIINVPNVTIKGYTLTPAAVLGETAAVYLNTGDNTGTTIIDNDIDGMSIASSRGIIVATGGTDVSVTITNNYLHNLVTGIYTNSHTGIIEIKHNSISNTVAGIGGATKADIQLNDFSSNDEAIGLDNSYSATWTTIRLNNFDGEMVKNYGTKTVNAEKNWWGDWDPSDQVFGNVDYDPYLGGPVLGFINGNDWNDNGFADLHDFYGVTDASWGDDPIVIGDPDLQINHGNYHSLLLQVQLDGPTAENDDQGKKVKLDVTVTMGQGPAPSGN